MTRAQPQPTSRKTPDQQTLIDHLHELRTRLFWIILTLLLATSGSYLIKDQIMAVLMQPLGGQQLVYLTPIGGFNFIFKVSMYFGLVVILPVIIYQLYRFLEPLMAPRRKKSVFFFILASFVLAIAGGGFAYFAGLPAALHFLTGFTIQNVSAMLTVESYLAFVVAYVLGFAALFQIPLILMIINSIKPLPPRQLMGFQRFVILGAFIVAAIISPTPDVTNQAILAVPIILMYQIGVLLVWLQSRSVRRRERRQTEATASPLKASRPQAINRPIAAATVTPAATAQVAHTAPRPARPVMDIAGPRRTASIHSHGTSPAIRAAAPQPIARRPAPLQRPVQRTAQQARPHSIDGIVRANPLSQAS